MIAKRKFLKIFEKKFGSSSFHSPIPTISIDRKLLLEVFDSLNSVVFGSTLSRNRVNFFIDAVPESVGRKILTDISGDPNDARGFGFHTAKMLFLPDQDNPNEKACYVDRDALVINTSYNPVCPALAVSNIYHEMIHMYDLWYGDLTEHYYEDGPTTDKHATDTFKNQLKIARSLGVMVDDEGKANNMKEMNQLEVDCLSSTSFFTEDETVFPPQEAKDLSKMTLVRRFSRGKPMKADDKLSFWGIAV